VRYCFESEFPSATKHCRSSYIKLLAYFSIIQPLFMELDQLLVSECSSRSLGFESELPSTSKYRTITHIQLTSYLYIVQAFLVEIDQLLVRER